MFLFVLIIFMCKRWKRTLVAGFVELLAPLMLFRILLFLFEYLVEFKLLVELSLDIILNRLPTSVLGIMLLVLSSPDMGMPNEFVFCLPFCGVNKLIGSLNLPVLVVLESAIEVWLFRFNLFLAWWLDDDGVPTW